ncbi:MAG: GNAT family N-acetyltransferase [Lachnospiraceae bacterium]|nr:GNAT family N-acetyltransferase [Lachnospiraceae bacterium]
MIKIIPYDKSYDNAISSLDRDIFLELKHHPDVLTETVHLAIDETRELIGLGYLLSAEDQRELLQGRGDGFVHLIERAWGEREAEASIALFDALMKSFEGFSSLAGRKDGRLLLRLWCREQDTAYYDFLRELCFFPARRMHTMACELKDFSASLSDIFHKVKENGLPLLIRALPLTEAALSDYLAVYNAAFYPAQSQSGSSRNWEQGRKENRSGDLRFKTDHYGGVTYAAFLTGERRDDLVAAVTIWRMGDQTMATENIFCHPAYQNHGVTRALLGYVLLLLKSQGVKRTVLTVYEDEEPAVLLYRSFGYHIRHKLIEMHACAGGTVGLQ